VLRPSPVRSVPSVRAALVVAVGLLVGSLAACAAPAGPRAPASPSMVQTVRRYPPLAFAADARAPAVAVVLATGSGGEATLIGLAPSARAVSVEPMATGTAVQVATVPAPAGRGTLRSALRGGDAAAWRASAWTATLAAASALGKDPGAFAVTAEARGALDAAATGGLVAGGLLASRIGVSVDPAATVAGVVLPDGTLGPVAAVDDGIAAARAAGKRRIGVPPGSRHRVGRRGRIDRVAEARKDGAQLVEVGDLRGAYLVMTGQRLPAPIPVAPAAMALDAGADEAARGELDTWTAALAPLWSTVLELDTVGGVPAVLIDAARAARSAGQAAEVLRSKGQLALASARLAEAWAYASAAATTWQVLVAATGGDLTGARARLAGLEPPPTAASAGAAPGLPSIDAALAAIAAEQRVIAATAQRRLARDGAVAALGVLDRVAASPPSPRRAGEELARATLPAALAAARATAAERAPVQTTTGADVRISDSDLAARTATLRDAAAALLAAVEPASAPGGSAIGRVALERARGSGLAGLAGAELAVLDTWTALALRTSLGAAIDPRTGRAARVAAAGALPALLTAAERAARGHAAQAAAATGAIPREARVAYQLAQSRHHGEVADRVAALTLYWRSSAWSALAVALARNAHAPASTAPDGPAAPGAPVAAPRT
jgi:hypothetical protein